MATEQGPEYIMRCTGKLEVFRGAGAHLARRIDGEEAFLHFLKVIMSITARYMLKGFGVSRRSTWPQSCDGGAMATRMAPKAHCKIQKAIGYAKAVCLHCILMNIAQKTRELTLLVMLVPLTAGAFLSVDLLTDVTEACRCI